MRLSLNKPEITHGIPLALRKYENGLLYARQGTDGYDYIGKYTGAGFPFASYAPVQVEQLRLAAVQDASANPMFPGKLWSEVSDEMITAYAETLEEKTCGHVFHRPWDGSSANGSKIGLSHPAIAQKWIDKQKHS